MNARRATTDSNKSTNNRQPLANINATRVVASSFGVLAGLTGLIAGFYEMRQGNVASDGYWISYIGPGYSMWQDFTYEAFTVLPNLYVAGVLTIITSILLLAWSVGFIHRRRGASVTLLLSITLVLVGGAKVYDIGALASLIATRIDQPLTWWRSHTSAKLRLALSGLWPWSTAAYALISLSLLVLTILGVNDPGPLRLITVLAGALFIPIPLMIVGGLAHDIQRQDNLNENT